ncbi:hypothetical protein B0T10DRAFT_553359 [Thelonectria olida]|uniref:Uncharacterized protein n=1 Tax=Thelonectria olida TaxID=1576542 RepID=A0A9P9AEZ7_9HYPO|nr:hypothetical protein B0T10DRAFT_553359 [Thelonectria olida]
MQAPELKQLGIVPMENNQCNHDGTLPLRFQDRTGISLDIKPAQSQNNCARAIAKLQQLATSDGSSKENSGVRKANTLVLQPKGPVCLEIEEKNKEDMRLFIDHKLKAYDILQDGDPHSVRIRTRTRERLSNDVRGNYYKVNTALDNINTIVEGGGSEAELDQVLDEAKKDERAISESIIQQSSFRELPTAWVSLWAVDSFSASMSLSPPSPVFAPDNNNAGTVAKRLANLGRGSVRAESLLRTRAKITSNVDWEVSTLREGRRGARVRVREEDRE